MSDDVFTADDFASHERTPNGPAYYAARRMAQQLCAGMDAQPLKKVADTVIDQVRTAIYDYVEWYLRDDIEANLQHHIQRTAEATVDALLTGQPWAMDRYPLNSHRNGEEIRATVAKHGGDALLMARIADLEKEVARLTEDLRFYRSIR